MTIINDVRNETGFTVTMEMTRNEMYTVEDVLRKHDCYKASNISGYFTACDYYATFEIKNVNYAAMKELKQMED